MSPAARVRNCLSRITHSSHVWWSEGEEQDERFYCVGLEVVDLPERAETAKPFSVMVNEKQSEAENNKVDRELETLLAKQNYYRAKMDSEQARELLDYFIQTNDVNSTYQKAILRAYELREISAKTMYDYHLE